MNTLSMNADNTLALAERAARLEHFELAQAKHAQAEAEAEAEALREQLREKERVHVDEIGALKRSGLDPVATAVSMLQEHPALVERCRFLSVELVQAGQALSDAEAEKTTLAEQIEALMASTTAAGQEKERAGRRAEKLERDLETAQSAIRHRDGELKGLRAFNPKKQQALIKKLQARNGELMEMDKRNRTALKTANDDLRSLRAGRDQLKRENAGLVSALDDACEQIGQDIPHLWDSEDGKWALIGHQDAAKRLLVLYVPTGELRLFDIEQEVVRAPAVPPYVKDEARARLERYSAMNKKLNAIQAEGGAA